MTLMLIEKIRHPKMYWVMVHYSMVISFNFLLFKRVKLKKKVLFRTMWILSRCKPTRSHTQQSVLHVTKKKVLRLFILLCSPPHCFALFHSGSLKKISFSGHHDRFKKSSSYQTFYMIRTMFAKGGGYRFSLFAYYNNSFRVCVCVCV